MDFTQYQPGYFSGENLNYFVTQNHLVQNLQAIQIEEEDPDLDLYVDKPPCSSSSEATLDTVQERHQDNFTHQDLGHQGKKQTIKNHQTISAHHLRQHANLEEDQRAQRT